MALSGTVLERVSGRPIEGANVSLWPLTIPAGGWDGRGFKSDESGRFRIPGLPADLGPVWITVELQGYRQQCAATATLGADDASVDVALVSRDNLSAANAQAPKISGTRLISGVVYDVTETGRYPLEGALVGWEVPPGVTIADTLSDTGGRYILCGLPAGSTVGLFGYKEGFTVEYPTAGTDGSTVDIEMSHR